MAGCDGAERARRGGRRSNFQMVVERREHSRMFQVVRETPIRGGVRTKKGKKNSGGSSSCPYRRGGDPGIPSLRLKDAGQPFMPREKRIRQKSRSGFQEIY